MSIGAAESFDECIGLAHGGEMLRLSDEMSIGDKNASIASDGDIKSARQFFSADNNINDKLPNLTIDQTAASAPQGMSPTDIGGNMINIGDINPLGGITNLLSGLFDQAVNNLTPDATNL